MILAFDSKCIDYADESGYKVKGKPSQTLMVVFQLGSLSTACKVDINKKTINLFVLILYEPLLLCNRWQMHQFSLRVFFSLPTALDKSV